MLPVKKGLLLLMILCLCAPWGALAQAVPATLSYEPEELDLPAVGLMVYVPVDLQRTDGDEEAFDLGFRYSGSNASNTFELDVKVHDSRDMTLSDFAAFYGDRCGYPQVQEERINGFDAQRLTNLERSSDFTILLAMPDDEAPQAVYALTFLCDGEADVRLADEILSTLALYGY